MGKAHTIELVYALLFSTAYSTHYTRETTKEQVNSFNYTSSAIESRVQNFSYRSVRVAEVCLSVASVSQGMSITTIYNADSVINFTVKGSKHSL